MFRRSKTSGLGKLGSRLTPQLKRMTQHNKQIAAANDEADERADGAEFAQQAAKEADQVRKQRDAANKFAATFHREVEDLEDMEEVVGEIKQQLQWRFGRSCINV